MTGVRLVKENFLAGCRFHEVRFVVISGMEAGSAAGTREDMRFMAMIKATSDYEAGKPPNPELMAAMGRLSEEMQKLGKCEMGGGLLPTSQGHKVSMSGGKVTITDGP